MTVLLWGVPSEPPMAMVAREVAALGGDAVVLHPRAAAEHRVRLVLDTAAGRSVLTGALYAGGRRIDLAAVTGAYLRPVDPSLVPEFRNRPPSAPEIVRARRAYDGLAGFTEVAPPLTGCRVVNRLSAMASNVSKPFQAQVILRHGFATPETLVSNDPGEVLEFVDQHHEVVYKSCSGVRSVVTAFDAAVDRDRLGRLRWCPVQFQERVTGPDIRVHVIGADVYATLVDSAAIDYRYARAQVGLDARLLSCRLDDEIAQRCIALAADLDLPFAGIDLKLSPDGRVVCFEVNPSPGFSWYENETGLPIARAVARQVLNHAGPTT